jgi:hypothetical protein
MPVPTRTRVLFYCTVSLHPQLQVLITVHVSYSTVDCRKLMVDGQSVVSRKKELFIMDPTAESFWNLQQVLYALCIESIIPAYCTKCNQILEYSSNN